MCAQATGAAMQRAKKCCRVCFETPFSKIFGFEDPYEKKENVSSLGDPEISAIEVLDPTTDEGLAAPDCETAMQEKMERWLPLAQPRAFTYWSDASQLKRTLS